ncbi:MAG: hypothetical protein ACJARD_000078 [Alphaproteobacteria bacterium]|jgi:hypothetical protein
MIAATKQVNIVLENFKEKFKEYPYAFSAVLLGIISLLIIGLIYVGIFDMFVPVKEQGKGMFNFLTSKNVKEKNIIDYLNTASIIIAILSIISAFLSWLMKEEKRVANIALFAGLLPLMIHFFLLTLIIAIIIVIIFNVDSISDWF